MTGECRFTVKKVQYVTFNLVCFCSITYIIFVYITLPVE